MRWLHLQNCDNQKLIRWDLGGSRVSCKDDDDVPEILRNSWKLNLAALPPDLIAASFSSFCGSFTCLWLMHAGSKIKGCLQNERAGLIQIKSYFTSTNQDGNMKYGPNFPAWHVGDNTSDCCRWEGVKCNPSTRRVAQLVLRYEVFTYEPWNLNMTFFHHFEELRTLDLSGNHIGHLIEDEGLCRLKNLEELIFSQNFLSKDLPRCLWNLTSLRVLDLSNNEYNGELPPYLDIPSLEWLWVNANHFQGKFSFSSMSNHSKLQGLMLSENALQVEIQDSSYPSTFKLQALGLGNCNLSTQAKTFWEFLSYQSNLRFIDLSDNALVGSFPSWMLPNNSNLKFVNLANNLLTGGILELTKYNNLSLLHLDISINLLSGKIPSYFGMGLSTLNVLELSTNSFHGPIPSSVGNMTQLVALDFSDNKLSGELPRELFSDCTKLQYLFLSFNNLEGEAIPEYMNVPLLSNIILHDNYFVGTMKKSLMNSTSLELLNLSNNMVAGELPSWIGSFEILQILILANIQFNGSIPIQLCQLGILFSLDLSNNRFVGQMPPCDINLYSLKHYKLSGNNLTGVIPPGLAGNAQLVTLDLTDNQISRVISPWIGMFSNLGSLLLRGNQLQGELPSELCQLKLLNILDLSNNIFSGVIPSCLQGLSFGVTKLNDIYSAYHERIENSSVFTKVPVYYPVEFVVSDSDELNLIVKRRYDSYRGNILSIMSILDLSSNQLVGEIPAELGDLSMINALNLSYNCLTGPIPESFSKLKSIEGLDLSYNNLSGAIPPQLANLNFLAIFNVSYNSLSGEVPETGQFGSFDENNYLGNRDLCGSRLPKSCTVVETPSTPLTEDGDQEDYGFDFEVFFWSFGASGITVLLSILLVLYLHVGWRRAWFAFIDMYLLWWFYL